MRCTIVSSENKQQFEKVQSITLPAFSGELQILPKHAEGFIVLQKGDVVLGSGEKNGVISIDGGVCHVKDDAIFIIL